MRPTFTALFAFTGLAAAGAQEPPREASVTTEQVKPGLYVLRSAGGTQVAGNVLAVLSWTFMTAPIATRARLTLYYQLEKICGHRLVTVYNLANGVMFCFLAGAMITVAATASGSRLLQSRESRRLLTGADVPTIASS